MRETITFLNHLLLPKRKENGFCSLITGYNMYDKIFDFSKHKVIIHMHETEEYKNAMLNSLEKIGYSKVAVQKHIRRKRSCFLWDPRFTHRDGMDNIFSGLKIKNSQSNKLIDLPNYKFPLANYPEFALNTTTLLAENRGWELSLPFQNETTLDKLVELLVKKSHSQVGCIDCKLSPWPGAYETPVIIIRNVSEDYFVENQEFVRVSMFSSVADGVEVNFIIRNKLGELKNINHYVETLSSKFDELACYANRKFVFEYIDK